MFGYILCSSRFTGAIRDCGVFTCVGGSHAVATSCWPVPCSYTLARSASTKPAHCSHPSQEGVHPTQPPNGRQNATGSWQCMPIKVSCLLHHTMQDVQTRAHQDWLTGYNSKDGKLSTAAARPSCGLAVKRFTEYCGGLFQGESVSAEQHQQLGQLVAQVDATL